MASQQRPPAVDDTKHHIVQSLFSRVDESGTADETLISYLKVYEDEGEGGQKTRYLMLAVTKFGKVVMHKAKRNNNLSFSKGKTWHLDDVRALEVIGPVDFALTMTIRRYHWVTDSNRDQTHFLNSVAKVYKTYTKNDIPELINFTPQPPPSAIGSGPTSAPLTASSSAGSVSRNAGPMFSPPGRSMDLAPPPKLKDHRSGSSSSMASAAGSHYASERSQSQSHQAIPSLGRPSVDGDRYGRSPLAESFAPLPMLNNNRRPSGDAMAMRPSEDHTRRPSDGRTPSPYVNGTPPNVAGLGMGMPSSRSQPDRLSVGEHFGNGNGSGQRRPSIQTSNSARRPSTDQVSQASAMQKGVSNDRQGSSSSRSAPDVTIPAPKGKYSEVFEEDDNAKDPRPSDVVPSTPLAPPKIMTTLPSPATATDPRLGSPMDPNGNGVTRKITQRRASFHPPPLNTAFSREVLLTSKTGALPGAAGMTVDDDQEGPDAIMNSVEDMLESFDWTVTNGGIDNGRKKGSADAIESRLLDELSALDSANIHAFLESDDRISQVLGHIDEALLELDDIDLQITSYKMQLNAVSDDISYIESQNRGLQVQTSNQQALLTELRQLLEIAEVAPDDLRVLAQESPGSARGVQNLERAAASLYKALQAGMDQANAEVAATIARTREYQENSHQFCKRLQDYLDVAFKHQSESTLAEFRKGRRKNDGLQAHTSMGEYLMMYEGLVLYMKEMDEDRYQRLCSNYMAAISQLHQAEMKELLMGFIGSLNTGGETNEASFATAAKADVPKPSALQKSRAAIGFKGSDPSGKKEKTSDENALRVAELYQKAISEMINQMVIEEDFINAFLHLTDTESTFADHMELDSYFRRQAARHASKAISPGLMQLVRSSMDLVFGFVDNETKNWVEAAVGRDPVTIVGIIAVTEKVALEAEREQTSMFFSHLFEKQLSRQRAMLDAFVGEQMRIIDGAKASKRRKGVAFFVRHFPTFVEKMEAQLEGAEGLPIRDKVNEIYDKVANAIFGTLSQVAKTDRGDGQAAEDKGQLNYHVIMIENMRHFVDDLSAINRPALAVFLDRAQGIYDENMSQYIRLMLRRSFGRLMDFFEGVDKVLQNTPPSEVSLHPTSSKSVLKKLLKDNTAKDMRKAVEAMAKRVDKQFSHDDDGSTVPDAVIAEVINTVWKAITLELKKETGRAQELIGRCYSDSNLGIEYGPSDVEAACKRAKA